MVTIRCSEDLWEMLFGLFILLWKDFGLVEQSHWRVYKKKSIFVFMIEVVQIFKDVKVLIEPRKSSENY